MERRGSAIWQGSLKHGKGTIATESRALHLVPYQFSTRFEAEPGTNPEELIAAAHAACFSMALAHQLDLAKLKAERIVTAAAVTLDKQDSGWTIARVHLTVRGLIPGVNMPTFEKAANEAKANCPVSKALNVPITIDLSLDA